MERINNTNAADTNETVRGFDPKEYRRALGFAEEDEPEPDDIINANIDANTEATEDQIVERATGILEAVRTFRGVRDPAIVALLEKMVDAIEPTIEWGLHFDDLSPKKAAVVTRARELQKELDERRRGYNYTKEENDAYLTALFEGTKTPYKQDYIMYTLQWSDPVMTRAEAEEKAEKD